MRDRINCIQFEKLSRSLRHRVDELIESNFLRIQVSDNPTTLSDFRLRYPRGYKETLVLIFLIPYLENVSLKWRMWLDLMERNFSEFSQEQEDTLKVLLSLEMNKEEMIFFLQTDLFPHSENEFWGWMFNKETAPMVNLYPKDYRVRKTQRVRGYRDHGSRKLAHEIHSDYENDFSSKQLQMKIELKSDLNNRINTLIVRLLRAGYSTWKHEVERLERLETKEL